MTANVEITTYENASAIVVPPEAVQGGAPTASVRVKDPRRI
jgi:HlyD family secretion protein